MTPFEAPVLGKLEIIEVLFYYDGPQIFSCIDENGQKYITHLVEETAASIRWFFIPVSDEQLAKVRTGEISLRNSVAFPENGWLWDVTIDDEPKRSRVKQRPSRTLSEAELPGPNAHLHLETIESNVGVAAQTFRDRLLISLDDGNHTHRIAVSAIGAVLIEMQRLIEVVGIDRNARVTKRLSQDRELLFAGTFVASVGICLESSKDNGLFGTPTEGAIDTLLKLFSAKDDRNSLSEILPTIHPWGIARYRELLNTLNTAGIALHSEWIAKNNLSRSATITVQQVKSILNILEEQEKSMVQPLILEGDVVLLGVFPEINKKSNFEFISSDGEHYKGALSNTMVARYSSGDSLEIPARSVIVTIEATVEFNPATGKEKQVYTLVEVKK